MRNLLLVLLVGCNATGNVDLKVDTAASEEPSGEPTTEPSGEPSAQPSEEPSGEPTSEPSGEPTAEPSGEPSGEPTSEPVSTNKTWEGSREIDFPVNNYCTETQNESGFEITAESSSQVYFDACPNCNQMYQVTFDPAYICGVTVYFGTETIFGLNLESDQAELYYFYQYNNGEIFSEKVATAIPVNGSWEYDFESSYAYGRTEFPYTATGSFRLIE